MCKWRIESWTGRPLFDGREFASFEEGWDYIFCNVDDEDEYQDLYVEPVT